MYFWGLHDENIHVAPRFRVGAIPRTWEGGESVRIDDVTNVEVPTNSQSLIDPWVGSSDSARLPGGLEDPAYGPGAGRTWSIPVFSITRIFPFFCLFFGGPSS